MPNTIKDMDDIAIVGIGCRFAAIPDVAALWEQTMACQSAFSDHPDPAATQFTDPDSQRFDRLPTTRGAYLHNLYSVDPDLPILASDDVTAESTDELFLTQIVADSLRDAGFTLRSASLGHVSLSVGYSPPFPPATLSWLLQAPLSAQIATLLQRFFPSESERNRNALQQHLQHSLPPVPKLLLRHAHHHAFAAHIANRFGFMGPAIVVNAGAVSAMAAIRSAADDLRLHRCDLALAAALQSPLPLAQLFGLAQLHEFTSKSAPTPFGRDASGTLPGEGGGVLALRRRRDAERNGERIYAVIKDVAITSSDGTAREPDTAAIISSAIATVFRNTALLPETCAYLETHGTGIAATDDAELSALQSLFTTPSEYRPRLALGASKALSGHCFAAAGMLGVCKAACALNYKIIPPTVVASPLHQALAASDAPFFLPAEPRPWINSRVLAPRRAAVNAWDVEGLGACCLLEEHPEAL